MVVSMVVKVFLLLIFFTNLAQTARILCVFQFPSISHQMVYQPIWKELSLRGHQVVVVTPNPLKNESLTNLTEIDASSVYSIMKPNEAIEKTHSKESGPPAIMWSFFDISNKLQDAFFQIKEFQEIYANPDERFDLILVELLHPGMYSLAGHFKAPIIGVSSLGAIEATHFSVGNLVNPVIYPEMNYGYHNELSFFQKVYSIYCTLVIMYYYNYKVIPTADKIARQYLGNDLPYLGDLGRNVDMLFLNTNPIIYKVRPTVPTVIQLGFMHIREPKKLQKDLQEILDEAKNGVIYLSLGSNVKSSNLDKNELDVIIQDISELPYIVLWKWELDEFPGKPNNVIARKWFPQQDLLAHPNVKVFVTQGGLQSAEEAIVRGVPIVGMPFIGDQPLNVKKLVEAGVAIEVDPADLKRNLLKQAILQVAENPKYKKQIRNLKSVLLDHPMSGLEKAVWWCEYVIRHKGTKHLRSPTADIPLYEYLLLDVFAVILITLYLLYKVLRTLLFLVLSKISESEKIKTN